MTTDDDTTPIDPDRDPDRDTIDIPALEDVEPDYDIADADLDS